MVKEPSVQLSSELVEEPSTVGRKPNFFILGAPKCATTSLTRWLQQHPNVFIPALKEPDFFNTDDRADRYGGISTLEEYEALFRAAGRQHSAIGEASVFYLSSASAVRNILRYQPEARFIVLVRNPVEIAPALHAELVMYGRENVRDFPTAWRLQQERKRGRHMPLFSAGTRRLFYGELCSLGAQLERLLAAVPASRVLVLVVDDIEANPRREYLRVLEFLGVPDDGRAQFEAYNTARHATRPRLSRFWFILRAIRYRLRIERGDAIMAKIKQEAKVRRGRDPISAEITAILKEYFAEDVAKLGRLLQRDLGGWIN